MEHVQTQQTMRDNVHAKESQLKISTASKRGWVATDDLSPHFKTDKVHLFVYINELPEDGFRNQCLHLQNTPLAKLYLCGKTTTETKGEIRRPKVQFTFFLPQRCQGILVIFRCDSLCIQEASS